MDKEFLYFLTNKQGQSYAVVNGVTTQLLPTPLGKAPDGWKEKLAQWTRNTTYWGVVRSYSIPLRFVGDGATILRSRLYRFGPEDRVDFIVLRYNPNTGRHEPFFKGEIDFNTYEDQLDYFELIS